MDDAVWVMIPIPADVAEQFPESVSTPHVTLVYVGPATEAQFEQVALIVADEMRIRWSPPPVAAGEVHPWDGHPPIHDQKLALAGLGYFENDPARVAFARVLAPIEVVTVRNSIASRIEKLGIEVQHGKGPWVPHATLGYLEPGQVFAGIVPVGEWPLSTIEVWRGDSMRMILHTDCRIDKVALVDGSWVASREAGKHDVGSYATEAEARAALDANAVERTLAGRHDFGPIFDVAVRAPAVHTESRNAVEVYRVDTAMVGPAVASGTDWKRYGVLYSRADIVQSYIRDGREVREYRARADVFDETSRMSGVGVPVEVRHSPDLLTPYTVRGVAGGATLTVEVHPDNLHTCGVIMAWDSELIAHCDAGSELSVAYRCKVDSRGGTTDSGKRFDLRQYAIAWNSLAAEPKGRAGTARVLERLDAHDRVVTSSAAMLQLAAAASRPKTIIFDLGEWVRYDGAPIPSEPDPDPSKDPNMASPLSTLLTATGQSMAEIAASIGITEPELTAIIEGKSDLTADQAAKMVAAMAKMPADKTPAPPMGAPAKLMIDGKEMDIAPEVATYIAMLEEKVMMAGERADRSEVASRAAAAELKVRKDAQADMVTRADAEQMVADQATKLAHTIAVARKARGDAWSPDVRKDAADNVLHASLSDWQRGAITGVHGDVEGAKILARIDSKPPADRAMLLDVRFDDAADELARRTDNANSTKAEIERARGSEAARRADKGDVLADQADIEAAHAMNIVGTKPAG